MTIWFMSQVPPDLQIPIETLVDEERSLLSAILLGFTRSGDHLVSYTTGEDGWHLQLWSFDPGRRCRRLYNIPIFVANTEDGAEQVSLRMHGRLILAASALIVAQQLRCVSLMTRVVLQLRDGEQPGGAELDADHDL